MKKITPTGYDDYIPDDQPALYVSGGSGNLFDGTPEVHIEFVDPEDGTAVRGWFRRDQLIAALIDPFETPRPGIRVTEPYKETPEA